MSVEEQEAADWADAELDRLEAMAKLHTDVEELDDGTVIEETEDGRVKLTIPTHGR